MRPIVVVPASRPAARSLAKLLLASRRPTGAAAKSLAQFELATGGGGSLGDIQLAWPASVFKFNASDQMTQRPSGIIIEMVAGRFSVDSSFAFWPQQVPAARVSRAGSPVDLIQGDCSALAWARNGLLAAISRPFQRHLVTVRALGSRLWARFRRLCWPAGTCCCRAGALLAAKWRPGEGRPSSGVALVCSSQLLSGLLFRQPACQLAAAIHQLASLPASQAKALRDLLAFNWFPATHESLLSAPLCVVWRRVAQPTRAGRAR